MRRYGSDRYRTRYRLDEEDCDGTVRFTVPTATAGSRLGWAHPLWNVLIAVKCSYDR